MHKSAHAKLEEFKALEKNWDSYGGLPIDSAIIKAAHEWLDNMPVDIDFSHIGPCCDGTVGLEWDTGGRRLELEIETPDTMAFVKLDDADGDDDDDAYPLVDFTRSIELIRWVLAGL